MLIIEAKLAWFLFNHGDHDFEVKMGDRIAQLILEKIDTPPVEEVQDLDMKLYVDQVDLVVLGIESKMILVVKIGEK